MKKHSILPADTYLVCNRTVFSEQDRILLIMLYQPILGNTAISLYFTLWTYLDKSDVLSCEWTHHHLMTSMCIKLEELLVAREKLEAIGLLRTLVKQGDVNHYLYELYSPLSASEFLNNPILSTSLYNNVGALEYDKIVGYFKIPKINTKDYVDITKSFNEVFESVRISSLENVIENIREKKKRSYTLSSTIDLNSIVEMIPEEILNSRSITKDTRELIDKLCFIYKLDNDACTELIRNSVTIKRTIDKEKLKKNARNYYEFEHGGKLPSIVYRNQPEYLRKPIGDGSNKAKMIYTFETLSPYDFLSSQSGWTKPSRNDLKIVEYLMVELNLKPGVVNVLLDYVLRINNKKLNFSYVEVIASQWKRSNVETVEAAMKLANQEYKKRNKSKQKPKMKEEAPVWFDKEVSSKKPSEDKLREMQELLNEFK